MSEDPRPSWHEARERAAAAGTRLGTESVPLGDAVGRRLASDLVARIDLPHYASSAMDGWGVAGEPPWRIVAGDDARGLAPGECVALLTGAAIPDGVAAVLREERAEVADGVVRPSTAARADEPRPGEHIRPAASEAGRGETVIGAGTLLSPAHVALAAACGDDRLEVARRPRVGLLLTGDEVVLHGVPGPGRVRDSFGPTLPALLAGLGATTVSTARVGDSRDELARALVSGTDDTDLLISTGGTGRSDADHLRDALRDLGAEILVDGVRMRPGGPTLLARLADGRLLLGLPGNPLAAMLGLIALGAPLLDAATGAPASAPASVVLAVELIGRADTVTLVPVRRVGDRVEPVAHRGAAMMRGLAEAIAIVICPPEGVGAGASASALRLPW